VLTTSRALALLALALAATAVWWCARGKAVLPPDGPNERAIGEERAPAIATEERIAPPLEPVRVDREPVVPVLLDAAMQRPDTIAGIVAGEDGVPVAGAEIVVTGHEGGVSTDDAGRFWFAREPKDTRMVAIRGVTEWDRGDHEDLVATRWVPWGTHDLRFVLRCKVVVQIDLVDVDGKPVAGGVTFGPNDEHSVGTATSYSFRVSGGSHTLRCSLSDANLAAPPARKVDVVEPCRVTVVVGPWFDRTVVVTGRDGAPVAGSRVELVDPDRAARSRRDGPRTDEQGSMVLRGAGLVPRTVRVTGNHAPVVVEGVRLDVREPLLVRLGHDARLRVRLSPQDAVERMGMLQTRIGMRGPSDKLLYPTPLVDGDAIEYAVAPGAWEVALLDGPLAGALANVTLGAGESKTIDVSVPGLDVAYVAAEVVCDQANVHNHSYVYLAREPRPGDAADRTVALGVPAPRDGGCAVTAGCYRVRMPEIPQALSDEVVDVPRDGTIDAKFRVRLGNVVIRLQGSDGEPRRDVRVGLARDGLLTDDDVLGRTDGDGVVRAQCGVGTLQVMALPSKPFELTEGGATLSGPEPLRANVEPRTFVGTITVREAATTEATFVVR